MTALRPDILAQFRVRRLRCTPQRYAVFDYLLRHAGHPTAEQIYKAVNRSVPRASLATIYKNLHALAASGLIRQVSLEGHVVRFESKTDRHHHFVCDRCRRLENIEWFDIPGLSDTGSLGSRTVLRYEILLRGLCAQCSPHKSP